MDNQIDISKQSAENEKFSKDVAHIEQNPNAKKSRNIPVIKIIIALVIFIALFSVLAYLLLLVKSREEFQKISKEATTAVESKLKAYPNPLPNTCGEEVKMCLSGNVVEKKGFDCSYEDCPDNISEDLTRFWKVTNSSEKYIRTYENLDLKYKFDLVKNWDFIGKDYGFILYSPNYNCDEVIVISDTKGCDGTIIEMITSNTTAKTDVEEWYKSNENYFRVNSDIDWPSNYEFIQIAGVKAIRVENAKNNLSYFFIYDNNVYALKLIAATELDFKNSIPTMDYILNSFRFSEN